MNKYLLIAHIEGGPVVRLMSATTGIIAERAIAAQLGIDPSLVLSYLDEGPELLRFAIRITELLEERMGWMVWTEALP